MFFYVLVGIAVAILAVLFSSQNPTSVSVQFFKWKFESTLAVVCLLSFTFGFMVSASLGFVSFIRRTWVIRSQKKKISDLQDELADKEKRPIYDTPNPHQPT